MTSVENEIDRSNATFVFLDSWTVGTGRAGPMVDRMVDLGFQVAAARVRSLSEADAEEIYRTNHPIREENSWHVARLVYPMGRSLGLLLTRSDGRCACNVMREVKGKANPSLQRESQLRFDFNAPNRILSLMHSSDDEAAVRREARVFFSDEEIESALGGGSVVKREPYFCQQLAYGVERLQEPGLVALMASVRMRICDSLLAGCKSASTRELLGRYFALWEPHSGGCGWVDRSHVLIEAMKYVQLVDEESTILEPLLRSLADSSTKCMRERATFYRPWSADAMRSTQCLVALNSPESYSTWDSDRQVPEDALVDHWERLLFRSYLFNFKDLMHAHLRGTP